MELKELRIGNWVMGHHKPFRWGLKHFHLLKQSNLDEIIKEPIALTEEILLKCGFKRVPKNLYVDNLKDLRTAVTYKNGVITWNEDTRMVWVGNIAVDNIEYLHELQNLYYAVENKELEVKL